VSGNSSGALQREGASVSGNEGDLEWFQGGVEGSEFE